MADINRQIILVKEPVEKLDVSDFRLIESDIPSPASGEVLCRVLLLSLDPANRAWMKGRTYRPQIGAGEVMSGFTLAQVIDANGTGIEAGAIVSCEAGWQDYAALPVDAIQEVEVSGPLSAHLGLLGITGMTAYFGLTEIGHPIPGETVVVSAAAGATGHVVGQLAKIYGAHVVGITGSETKNRLLEETYGFDATVNHHDDDLRGALKRACPQGIDVYFDNVAGPVLDAVLARMNVRGRIVCCGAVSEYEQSNPHAGPKGVPGVLISRRLRMEGFLVLDYVEQWPEAARKLKAWMDAGELRPLEEILNGLESAPAGLVGLLAGDNVGKRLVRVAPDPQWQDLL